MAVEERSETHEKRDKYLETGPVGETPVHLAFLFEEGDNNHLGKRCRFLRLYTL